MPSGDRQPSHREPVRYVFNVERAIPELALHSGDRIVVTYSGDNPIVAVRVLPPNYGLIGGLLADDAVTVLGADSDAVTRWLHRLEAAHRKDRMRLLP